MAAAANSATSAACTAARSDEDEPNFVQEDGLLSDSQVSVAVYVRAAVGSLRAVATDSESEYRQLGCTVGAQLSEHHALSSRSNHQ